MATISTTRARSILVAGAIAIAIGGGSISAAPPGDSPDDEIEELAESAFQKWLISHGRTPVTDTLACAVDVAVSQAVYCYAFTETGIVAASAPIASAGAWHFTLHAGEVDGSNDVVGPTTTAAPPTEPPTTALPATTLSPAELTTSTAVQPAGASFGEGMHLINTQIAPGRYQAVAGDFCYWARLSAADDELASVIANDITANGPIIVDIDPTDAAFDSQGCGQWQPYASPPVPATSFGPGTYVVGSDIEPGTYRADGGPDCFWYRLSGFGGQFDQIVDVDSMASSGTVEILPSDVGFKTSGCGEWTLATRLSPPPSR
jgi:hypothetical protein